MSFLIYQKILIELIFGNFKLFQTFFIRFNNKSWLTIFTFLNPSIIIKSISIMQKLSLLIVYTMIDSLELIDFHVFLNWVFIWKIYREFLKINKTWMLSSFNFIRHSWINLYRFCDISIYLNSFLEGGRIRFFALVIFIETLYKLILEGRRPYCVHLITCNALSLIHWILCAFYFRIVCKFLA